MVFDSFYLPHRAVSVVVVGGYVYAYSQIRETALLLQVVQGVMFGMLFVTITIPC
ncbi:MAG: hypothetical protein HC884_14725 [Chloroflexaceae bacterium]|nr:hypothetical protein [Chloroflexaceae bacterium]